MEFEKTAGNAQAKYEFIDELILKKENIEYKIQFYIMNNYLVIQIFSDEKSDIFYHQGTYTINDFQKMSEIFYIFHSMKELIAFIKQRKLEILKSDEDLIISFLVYKPDGQSQLIKLILKQNISDYNCAIKYLFDEIKKLKENDIKKSEEILRLKQENENLMKYFLSLNNNQDKSFISINSSKKRKFDYLKFVFDYINQKDKASNLNYFNLLYKSSKHGDKTKKCHELCDNKENILILITSQNNYAFGGYSKIGFKTINNNNNWEYVKDNDSFLFSVNYQKIYPVIKDQEVICHIGENFGLCFRGSLAFYDNFMHENNGEIKKDIKEYFSGIENINELNGNIKEFKCKDVEVFQLTSKP